MNKSLVALHLFCAGAGVQLLDANTAQADIVLVRDGVAKTAIYVAPAVMAPDTTPAPPASYAEVDAETHRRRLRESIRDFTHYVQRMSGARLEVLTTAPVPGDKRLPIYVGSLAQQKFGPAKQKVAYRQGFRLVVSQRGLGLIGESDESASYAIYEILDRLGCRWVMPSDLGEVIPTLKTVALPAMDLSSAPSTSYRSVWYADDAFRRRNRMGGFPISAGHALEVANANGYGYLTRKQLEEHPDWNAMIGGKRSINGRFCWGNPEVSTAVADSIVAVLDKQYVPTISLSPEDGTTFCECPLDKALDTGDWDAVMGQNSITDRYIHFCNRIAERVTKKYPDVQLGFLAYVQFTQAPLREKLHPNLVPMIAPINYCRAHAFIGPHVCESRAKIRTIVEGWARASRRISYYNYMFNLAEYSAPYPMMHQMSQELPVIYKNNVEFWQPEGMANFESVLPGLYLANRMAWNTKLQPAAVLDEFFTRFYGAVAAPMRKYWTLIDDAYTKVPEHAGSGFGYWRRFTPEVMKQARAAMDEALVSTRTPMEYRRVKMQDESLRQFERFMQLRWDLNEGRLAKMGPQSERWMSRQLDLGDDYEPQSAFSKAYWSPNVAGRWFELFFQPAYLDGTRIATNFDVISAPLRQWKYSVDKEKTGEAQGWNKPDFSDAAWKTTDVGVETWGTLGLDTLYGSVWYRSTVKVPDVPAGKKVYLWVSSMDGNVKLFVNGLPVPYVNAKGETADQFTGGYCHAISFDISAAVKPNADNQIAIIGTRTFINELGTGGLLGPVYLYREK